MRQIGEHSCSGGLPNVNIESLYFAYRFGPSYFVEVRPRGAAFVDRLSVKFVTAGTQVTR